MADSPRIEELKRRVQSDPASIAFAALAEEYRRAGRFEEAIDTCTAGLVRHPSYLSAHVTLGRALLDVGRLDEAKRELESVLKIAPENLAAIRGLAEIHDRVREETHEQQRAPESASDDPVDAQMVAEIHAASGFTPPPAADLPEPAAHPAIPTPPDGTPSQFADLEEPLEADPAGVVDVAAAAPAVPDGSYQSFSDEHVPAPTEAAADEPFARPHANQDDPALAGLEEFLHAILRARAARAEWR